MWPGYVLFNGTEVINATRTEAYARHAQLQWFKPVYEQPDLAWLLGEGAYSSPLQDDAPWTDPDRLDSYDFYGVYPLEITGFEDSTIEATITESVIDGGYVSRPRRKTRTTVFSAVLVGASQCAVEYGMRWLRSVLTMANCNSSSYGVCGGADVCYLGCEPCIEEGCDQTAEECYDKIGRSMHDVTTTVGPVVTAKMDMNDGGCAWSVTWTQTAANPAEFGMERPIVIGFLDPAVEIPYAGGIIPEGGIYDSNGHVDDDPACPTEVYTPVYDPTCDLLSPPPDVPTVVPDCFDFPPNFRRHSFSVPRQFIPLWDQVVPIIKLTTKGSEARNVRLRFYADTFGVGNPENDPCNFCGDIVISYVPASSTLVIDGADHDIYLDSAGIGRRRADALATDSTGKPMDWPEFSCGFGYVVTVDMPQQQTDKPIVDLALVSRIA
jgi:hypothetical protein